MSVNKKTYKIAFLLILLVSLFLIFWFSIPDPLFNNPTCTVIEDRQGELLGARISDDGQWRFPYNDDVPEKFRQAIIFAGSQIMMEPAEPSLLSLSILRLYFTMK